MVSQKVSRRDFLRIAGAGAGTLFANRLAPFLAPTTHFSAAAASGIAQPIGGSARSIRAQMEPFVPDAEISLTAAEKWVQILPGEQTRVWSYEGQLLSGSGVTVLVWPGERVKVAMRFGPHAGMYMYHCHILEHEDMTMMRNYMIMDPMMPGM